ncbi:FbpB family small basic protein [Halalkalibacter nanhaiisediminis]|uniref:Fur-regulated basic protein B n=1 Tax=Halalkalibacter nanhaiisediminis TaxID=688079 RepID=A0A562QRB8_9BACI|nr:FbpB family small basic protein [Halalkalibacter nanhaiisediminis]TWI59274.1 Fur-regulated basic protein B [Halalkalibacter nanhaiisediminis]
MRRVKKFSFEELVRQNKENILNDKEAMDRLEEKWELRRAAKNQVEM